jgi:hypothetical protein
VLQPVLPTEVFAGRHEDRAPREPSGLTEAAFEVTQFRDLRLQFVVDWRLVATALAQHQHAPGARAPTAKPKIAALMGMPTRRVRTR